jgi:hypothetical protein
MKEKELLNSARHIALATVNEDGTPHNTPLFFAIDDSFKKLYFVSRDESLHSVNFAREGKGFAVLYDSNSFKGGLYLTIENGHKTAGNELSNGIKIYSAACSRWQIDVLPKNFHLCGGGYSLYVGNITKIEIYHAVEDNDEKLVQETRKEVSVQELLNE